MVILDAQDIGSKFCWLLSLTSLHSEEKLFVHFPNEVFGPTDGQMTFVSELSSKPAQKLSKYGWYGNVRLQRFHIPEETAIARWLFTVTKGHNFHCGQRNVTMYDMFLTHPSSLLFI